MRFCHGWAFMCPSKTQRLRRRWTRTASAAFPNPFLVCFTPFDLQVPQRAAAAGGRGVPRAAAAEGRPVCCRVTVQRVRCLTRSSGCPCTPLQTAYTTLIWRSDGPAPRVILCRVNDVLFQVRHCRRLDVSLSTLPAAVTHLIVPAPAPLCPAHRVCFRALSDAMPPGSRRRQRVLDAFARSTQLVLSHPAACSSFGRSVTALMQLPDEQVRRRPARLVCRAAVSCCHSIEKCGLICTVLGMKGLRICSWRQRWHIGCTPWAVHPGWPNRRRLSRRC